MTDERYIHITPEEFEEKLSDDEFVLAAANPVKVCDEYGNHRMNTALLQCKEYVLTPDFIEQAKLLKEMKKKELLENIHTGELVFVQMGSTFPKLTPDHTGQYRMRCNFCNKEGKEFFLELGSTYKGDKFSVSYSIDLGQEKEYNRELEEVLKWNEEHPLYSEKKPHPKAKHYNAFGATGKIIEGYTWTNVLKFVNETYGCDYKSIRAINHYLSSEDFTNKC